MYHLLVKPKLLQPAAARRINSEYRLRLSPTHLAFGEPNGLIIILSVCSDRVVVLFVPTQCHFMFPCKLNSHAVQKRHIVNLP